jgi:segregation and condensation protein B
LIFETSPPYLGSICYNRLANERKKANGRHYNSAGATIEVALKMQEQNQLVLNEISMTALLESVLFVASGPLSIGRLAKVLETTPAVVDNLLHELDKDYRDRGIRLQWSGSEVQLTTAPESSHVIERLLGLELTTRLSQAALEVLAIIAFMQPATRPQIDQIRGVNSDSSLRTLLGQGLIEEVGRLEGPGRPILYGTTPEFLQYFGLGSLDELPNMPGEEEE